MLRRNENLKILLIYPSYPDTFWSFKHALKFMSKKAFIPPLGLLTVAALLPKTWQLRLVNLNMDALRNEDIQWADYIFLSAMEVQQASVREVINKVKSYRKKIVAGGPLFTLFPEKFQEVDHLVLREAEGTLLSFIEDLEKGEAKRIYDFTEWPDLSFSPIPEWNLLDLSKYAVMTIQYSRGCPFDCEFCDVALLNGKRIRTKTPAQILSELEGLYQRGWRSVIFFGDDNFIGKPRELKEELLPALIKWTNKKGHPFSFMAQATLDLADDDELMALMARAGFDSVFVGIESPEEKSLQECHKVQNKKRDMMVSVRKMQRFGFEVLGGFIIGFDSDPPTIFKKQIDFIQESGIVTAMVGLLNAPRGTKLYKRLQQEGRLLGEWTGNNTDFSLNFIPKMGSQMLLDGYRSVLNYIYSPRYFYERLVTFLRNYTPPKKNRTKVSLRHIKALLRSIWVLGIWGEERFYYWKTLSWTALRRPGLFRVCVALAIFGYHFKNVFQARISKSEDLSGRAFDKKESTREKFGIEETHYGEDLDSVHVRGSF